MMQDKTVEDTWGRLSQISKSPTFSNYGSAKSDRFSLDCDLESSPSIPRHLEDQDVKELPPFPLFSSSKHNTEDQSAFSSILFADTPMKNNDTDTIIKLTNHAEELKLELDMWRKAYREQQAKHTTRLESLFKEQKQREEEIREKYEEDKTMSLKNVSKASFIILSDMKNLLYLLKHQNPENLFDMITTELNEKDIAGDQFVSTYLDLKSTLHSIFHSFASDKHNTKDQQQAVSTLKSEKERLEKELVHLSEEKKNGMTETNQFKDNCAEYERKIAELEEKIFDLESQILECKGIEERVEKIKLERIDLERQINYESKTRKNLEETVENLTSLNREADIQIDQLRQQIQQREYIVKTKQGEIEKLNDIILKNTERIHDMEREKDRFKEKYGEYDDNSYGYNDLRNDMEEASKRLTNKIQENEELRHKLGQMQKFVDMESEKSKTLIGHNNDLSSQIERLKDLLMDNGVMVKNAKDYRSVVEKTIEFANLRSIQCSSMVRDIENFKKRLEDSEQDHVLMKTDLEKVISSLERKMNEDMRARDEERLKFESVVNTLEEQIKQKRDAANEMAQEQAKRLNRNIERLQIDLAEKDKQLQSANNTIRSLRDESDISFKASEERIRQLEESSQKKDEQFSKQSLELTKELEHLKKKLKKLSTENEATQVRLEVERNNIIKESSIHLEESQNKIGDYENKIDILNEQISQQIKQLRDQDERITLLQKEREDFAKHESSQAVEQMIDEQIRQLQDHYESEKVKYRQQYEHMVKKYKAMKEKFFKQSLRQNELQNYLLKIKKKHKKRKEEEQEQDVDSIVEKFAQQHSNLTSMPSAIPTSNAINAVVNPYHSGSESHHIYYESPVEEQNNYPRYIVAHPPPSTIQTSSPSVHISENIPPSYFQPVSSVSITSKKPKQPVQNPKILQGNTPYPTTQTPSSLNNTTTTTKRKKKTSANSTLPLPTTSTSKRPSSNPHSRRQ